MNATRKALGRWPNAPLALVLAQVKFETCPETTPAILSERIKNIAGAQYPDISPLQQVSFIVGEGGPQSIVQPPETVGLDMRNPENVEALRLQLGAFTFMTSSYQDSSHFAGQWRSFMNSLCETRELRVTRLGLRYVDFIIPSVGHVPEDYFRDNLGRSPMAIGEQSQVAFNLYDYMRANGGQLRLQYGRGFGPPNLPPDLNGSIITPSGLTTRSNTDISAVLDMDRWCPFNNVAMTAEAICKELEVLRTDMATTFRSIMSELADDEWQCTPEGEN